MASNAIRPQLLDKYYAKDNDIPTQSVSKYQYSFSGADVKALVFFPFAPNELKYLNSVHTVSISIHEAKAPARALGHRNIKGVARSVRSIAGSLILTVINDHPLRPLMDMLAKFGGEAMSPEIIPNWSVDNNIAGVGTFMDKFFFQNRIAGMIPPFNLLLEFVSETAPVFRDRQGVTKSSIQDYFNDKTSFTESDRNIFPAGGLMIEGIDIIDEGFVVSVNDQVTEITMSYIAKDIKPFSSTIQSIVKDPTEILTVSEMQVKEAALIKKLFNSPTANTYSLLNPPEGNVEALPDEAEIEGIDYIKTTDGVDYTTTIDEYDNLIKTYPNGTMEIRTPDGRILRRGQQ